jgi:hypothetical protein
LVLDLSHLLPEGVLGLLGACNDSRSKTQQQGLTKCTELT